MSFATRDWWCALLATRAIIIDASVSTTSAVRSVTVRLYLIE